MNLVNDITQIVKFKVDNGILIEEVIEKGQHIKLYKFTAYCKDIKRTSKEANPRKQDITKKNSVANKIRETLLDEEISFHTRNKGITYFAENIEIIKNLDSTYEVTVMFGDLFSQGSVDGGHTELVILDEEGNYPEWKKVNVEVITGITNSSTHVSIAESRNTGTQVTAETLDELSGMHDILKDHLERTHFIDRVSFKQNENKEDGKDLTITLIKKLYETFNLRDYADKDPKGVYSSNQGVINKYRKEFEEHGLSSNNIFEKLNYVSKDIFFLTNYIHKNFKDLYNSYGKGNFLASKCADYKEGSRKESVLFGAPNEYLDYKVPNGLLFMALSGFRQLLTENDFGYYEWKVDIYDDKKFNAILKVIFEVIATAMKSRDNNPQSVGKDAAFWELVRTKVFMEAYSKRWL
ncbi:AIPR family protein [Gottfriedia acidiceleris]|uniref:AIPR family protein n=1 Tax=Gottfriedia acidiceleris TaxID=371036 RepID=UPI003396E709